MSYYNLPDPRTRRPRRRIQKVIGEDGREVGEDDNPNPYCSRGFVTKLDMQKDLEDRLRSELDRKLKRDLKEKYREDMAEREIERQMSTNLINAVGIKKLINRTWCDHCNRTVMDIQAEHHGWNHWYRLRVRCHGEEKVFEVTQAEWIYVVNKDQKRAYAFIEIGKQKARDEMTRRLFAKPRQLLLQFKGAMQKLLCYNPGNGNTDSLGCVAPGTEVTVLRNSVFQLTRDGLINHGPRFQTNPIEVNQVEAWEKAQDAKYEADKKLAEVDAMQRRLAIENTFRGIAMQIVAAKAIVDASARANDAAARAANWHQQAEENFAKEARASKLSGFKQWLRDRSPFGKR